MVTKLRSHSVGPAKKLETAQSQARKFAKEMRKLHVAAARNVAGSLRVVTRECAEDTTTGCDDEVEDDREEVHATRRVLEQSRLRYVRQRADVVAAFVPLVRQCQVVLAKIPTSERFEADAKYVQERLQSKPNASGTVVEDLEDMCAAAKSFEALLEDVRASLPAPKDPVKEEMLRSERKRLGQALAQGDGDATDLADQMKQLANEIAAFGSGPASREVEEARTQLGLLRSAAHTSHETLKNLREKAMASQHRERDSELIFARLRDEHARERSQRMLASRRRSTDRVMETVEAHMRAASDEARESNARFLSTCTLESLASPDALKKLQTNAHAKSLLSLAEAGLSDMRQVGGNLRSLWACWTLSQTSKALRPKRPPPSASSASALPF